MQAPCSGLTLPWCRNAVAYIWYGIAVLPCFSTSAIIRRHSLWSPLAGHLCRISPQRAGQRSGISNSMSICDLTSGRQLPVLPFVAVLPSKTAATVRNHSDLLELRQRSLFKCPLWDTSLRGARGPIPNRNCTGASRASTSCRRRAAFTGRSLYSWSEDASPETLPAVVQTAGLEPAHTSWCGALPTELRLHTPGIRRGQEERKDGWEE